jgi:hypothetical protein
MRIVVVHYHIFKNAGSSVDAILQQTFHDKWTSYDTDNPAGRINPAQLAQYIAANPDKSAISSHQAMLPLPAVDGVAVLPIMLLRHPLDRARSVYDFERRQGQELGPVSRGADHAARLSFADYLRWRFDTSENGVVHNFQTAWLCSSARNVFRTRIRDADFTVAQHSLQALPAFGLVERFDESLSWFADEFSKQGVNLNIQYRLENVTHGRDTRMEARLERTQELLGAAMWDELVERNRWDLQLHEFGLTLFLRRHGEAAPPSDDKATPSAR